MDFASSKARFKPSAVEISGFGMPARTITPTPERAISVRVPDATLPPLARSSMTLLGAITTSAAAPASASRCTAGPPANRALTLWPLARSNCGISSSMGGRMPPVLNSLISAARTNGACSRTASSAAKRIFMTTSRCHVTPRPRRRQYRIGVRARFCLSLCGFDDEERGVDRDGVEVNGEMEMRSGRAAGGTHGADLAAGVDRVGKGDIDGVQVRVKREKAKAMVEHYHAAIEEVLADVDDAPGGRGEDGRADRRREIEAVVPAAQLIVEVALQAEAGAAPPARGLEHGERSRRRIAEGAEQRLEVRALALVAREVFSGEVDLARRHLEMLASVRLRLHFDLELLAPAVGMVGLQAQLRARLRGESDADEGDPRLAFAHHEHGIVAEPHARRLLRRAERNFRHAARNRVHARQDRARGADAAGLRGKRCSEGLEEPAPVQIRAV